MGLRLLVADDSREPEVAGQGDAGSLECPQRAQLGGHRPFHVGGAAPVETVSLAAAGHAVADRDRVQVPVQHQAGAVACPRQPRVDVVTAVAHPALIDVEAELAQLGSVVLADLRLLHGHAGDLHHRLRLPGDPLAIDRVFQGCPLLLVLFHLFSL